MGEDRSGIEAIPLRLMIIAVVASLSIVPAADMLQNLKNREFVKRAILQLEGVIAAAEIVAIEGPGSVRTLELDFKGGDSMRFRGFRIGDLENGPNASAVVLELSNGASIIRMMSEPSAWLRSQEAHCLYAEKPVFDLRIEGVLEGQVFYILAEVR